jgi:predicted transcriptional regulator YdeE
VVEKMSQTAPEAKIVQFGPCRAIGLSYVGKYDNEKITALWDGPACIFTRIGEIPQPPVEKSGEMAGHPMFGLCRCVAGAADGCFEYIAAAVASAEAPVPEGMVEVSIPACSYAVFEVPSLEETMAAWEAVPGWHAAHPEWKGFCGPDGCDCAGHPSFELYPPDFCPTGRFYLYVPVKPAT